MTSDKNELSEQSESSPVESSSVESIPAKSAASADGPLAQALNNDLIDRLKNINKAISQRIQSSPRTSTMIFFGVLLLLISILMKIIGAVPTPHVSIGAEPLFDGGWVTNSFIHTIIVDIILIALAYFATRRMQLIPSGLQNFVEAVIEYLYSFCESVAGHNARRDAPWALTVFLLIIISNWTSLIPGVGSIGIRHIPAHQEDGEGGEGEDSQSDDSHGLAPNQIEVAGTILNLDDQLAMSDASMIVSESAAENSAPIEAEEGHGKFVPLLRPPSADLNFTFALAIATMVMVQVHGVRALGAGYFKKFWNTSGKGAMKGVNIFVSVLEFISEVSRILTFAFRLFGNIFAGEVVLATMAFLIAFLLPIPFYFLELFVGFVQSMVFMMLALIFFSLATVSHDADHH